MPRQEKRIENQNSSVCVSRKGRESHISSGFENSVARINAASIVLTTVNVENPLFTILFGISTRLT